MTSTHPGAPARHLDPIRSMRIALLGDASGSPDPAAEEVGRRLVQEGHRVTLYGRPADGGPVREHHGRRCVDPGRGQAPLSAVHLAASGRQDVAVVFGAASAPLIPLLRSHGTAVALRVDGLEWKRQGLTRWGRRYLRAAEQVAVREADALITGSRAMQDYFEEEFAVQTELIGAGSTLLRHVPTDLIEGIGLVPRAFHLAVAGAEHRVEAVVAAHRASAARLPLVVVGATPEAAAGASGAGGGRLRLLGEHPDPRLLEQLHAHAIAYVHGRSNGGDDAALLRAMGAGTPVLAHDVVFNREVVGTGGLYFDGVDQLAQQLEEVERYPLRFAELGELMQERARQRHDWDRVAEDYERLAAKLTKGFSTRGMSSGRRLGAAWSRGAVDSMLA